MRKKVTVRKREYHRNRRVRSQIKRAEELAQGTRKTRSEIQKQGEDALQSFLASGREITSCPAGKKPSKRSKNYRPRV